MTSQLWRDGAVMLGKLNNDEFAMGSSNETSCFGPVVNPWRREGSNTTLVPGGSSGGSASAVAALLCAWARPRPIPAARSASRRPSPATVGVKPTYGRCSRWGIVALRVLARSGRSDRAHRARRRDPDALDGRARSEGHDLGRSRGAGLRGRDRKIRQGHEDRHPEGVPPRRHAGRKSKSSGARARRG